MTTAAEVRTLIDRARAALVEYIDHPVPAPCGTAPAWQDQAAYGAARHAQEATARRLVNECIRHGITVARILTTTAIPFSAVIPLVEGDQHRADALAAEAHRLEHASTAVRRLRAADAVRLHSDGMRKVDLACFLGVTRVTLDRWLSSIDGDL